MSDGHRQTVWARVLLASLAEAGVREVIVSPGSRSTPLVAAAAAEERLRCRHLLDERSAAFFALGQARASGHPSLLICTSGTAVANYLPAVVEAGVDHLPLLVLSADRPVELSHGGANQTIDQIKLFGDHARAFFDLGAADATPDALRALRRLAAQAVFTSLHPTPGAVHLNARLRKPLEPIPATSGDEERLDARISALLERSIVRPSRPRAHPDPAALDELIASCQRCERGLIVCGPSALAAGPQVVLFQLARRLGFPVLRETTSQLRLVAAPEDLTTVDAFDAILRSARFRTAYRPQLVLQVGRAPTSGQWLRFAREHAGRMQHWVIAEHGWHDPESSATHLLLGEVELVIGSLLERLPAADDPADGPWTRAWQQVEELAWREIGRTLDEGSGGALSEGWIARQTVDAVPGDGLLAVGNSLPVRQVDLWARGRAAEVAVWAQRGASGIDGLFSGVCGAVSVLRRPAVLLIGDVSFLHDLSGTVAAREVDTPLVVVVVDNGGGRIFEQLPFASHPAAAGEAFELWTTPHTASIEAAAAVHGLAFARVTRREELARQLAAGLEHPGVTVIQTVVPPHGAAEENARVHQRVSDAVGRWLDAQPG